MMKVGKCRSGIIWLQSLVDRDEEIKTKKHNCLYDRGERTLEYKPMCDDHHCPIKECPLRRYVHESKV